MFRAERTARAQTFAEMEQKTQETGEQRLFPSKSTGKSRAVKVRLKSSGLAASRVVQGEPGRCPEHKQDSRANRSP